MPRIKSSQKERNKLSAEKSPYLLEHAGNPVDWYPWGDEAFERARCEDRPLFVSIGYSTCHWCHVMARESFEDDEVADLLNDAFVCVKVDREERPDVDSVYMEACQLLTGSGGWPLNVVLTPELKPFFAATYIPKENRWGRMGMLELVPRLKAAWQNNRAEAVRSADAVIAALEERKAPDLQSSLGEREFHVAYSQLALRFDRDNGGFGTSPKFPSPHNLFFMLRYWRRFGRSRAINMVRQTLDAMAAGGIHDHLGGGFHRYSTDRAWLVPHFEKMLYDQAMLALAYTEAYSVSGKSDYARVARGILDYAIRDMRSRDGGFYSAEDADSDGKEGLFYLWDRKEIDTVLGKARGKRFAETFQVKADGNFNDESTGKPAGKNILHLSSYPPPDDLVPSMEELLATRSRRVRPHLDDKVLVDWNGLMIASLARSGRVLEEDRYVSAARDTANFIDENLVRDGQLLHRYRGGHADISSNLDDHAFLAWGLIELFRSSGNDEYLNRARHLADEMIRKFSDEQDAGFYLVDDDESRLPFRPRSEHDGACPSGLSVAVHVLLLMFRFTGEVHYQERADRATRSIHERMTGAPIGNTMMLAAWLDRYSWNVEGA